MDVISGALEGACGLADLACDAAGLNDFDLAMNNQAALIESEGILTREALNAQTSIMQSEAAANRANQAMMFYSSGCEGGSSKSKVWMLFLAAYLICMIILTIALI